MKMHQMLAGSGMSVFKKMLYVGKTGGLDDVALREALLTALDQLGEKKKVIIIPPDFTRFHSYVCLVPLRGNDIMICRKAGVLTQYAYEYYGNAVQDVMPALGTHAPMTSEERHKMFGSVPDDLFRVHNWREDVVTIGQVPSEMVYEASDGQVNEPWPAQLNKLVSFEC